MSAVCLALPPVRGRLTLEAPLAPLVWFKSGGPAEYLFEPADRDDLVDFLHMLVTRTASLIDGSTVGLLLTDQNHELRFIAASDENTRRLELFQVQNEQGPYRTSEPVINTDLRDGATPWPLFAPRAAAAGFRTVHAFPLRLRREVIGAGNIFGTTFDDADGQIVQALADIAAISLLQERSISRGEILTEQLQGALDSRIAIEQAKAAGPNPPGGARRGRTTRPRGGRCGPARAGRPAAPAR